MRKQDLKYDKLDKIVENYINSSVGFKISSKEDLDRFLNIVNQEADQKYLNEISKLLDKKFRYDDVEEQGYNKRLYFRWGKVFNRLKYIIEFSLYSIIEWQKFIDTRKVKNYILIRLHAKSILLSKEILLLLKNWYWEWANARWRSLYENTVITAFICDNNNDLAIRFFKHKGILNYKEALRYKESYEKLKHSDYWEANFKKLVKNREKLLLKYWKDFDKDYWWIPDKITKNKNFSEIEKLVDMSHFSPYFKLSSRSIHSSVKSFDNLWLWKEDVIMIWPSNIGLTDPLQNTAIFLMKSTTFILINFIKNLKDISNKVILLFFVKTLIWLEKNIWEECMTIEEQIFSDESNLNRKNNN